jgi:serine/threonine protein kinase/tetratricopeptide (TPR) repeat protein
MALAAGTSLGPYRILSLLGRGGMGEVYHAADDRLGRSVAVKVLPSEFAADADRRVRFEREARAIAAINHPNICAIYDVGREGDIAFLVMELLEGESLADRLRRGPLEYETAHPIAITMLETLAAVHERGLIHRDLKPANIFLTRHGVKLLDFGLARERKGAAVPDSGATLPGVVMGTPRYLAPEQLRGQAVDERTDVFAAASVIYEMLTGRPAFERASLVDVLHAVTYDEVAPLPSELAPAHVDHAVRRALSKDPAERPPGAAAFAAALRGAFDTPTAPVSISPALPAATRVIVLPFRMLRADADTDFLAFSLPDAVGAALSRLESVVVRSTLSAQSGPGMPDLQALARQVQVDAVVTGSLLRAGSELRLSAQLVSVPDGAILWSHTIQAPVHDLFQLQDALTHAVVSALHVPLSARDHRALRQDVPSSPVAYELFLRANELATQAAHWVEARALYEQAVSLDPGYAPAWARLGRVLRVIGKFGGRAAADQQARAERAFERALALNPDLPTAHYLYAHLEAETGRALDAMVRLLTRARSRPSDSELFAGLVTTCRYCGLLDEAIAAGERVRRLDPTTRTSVCYAHYMKGDYRATIATDDGSPQFATSLARLRIGEDAEAMAFMEALERDSPHEGVRIVTRGYRMAIAGQIDSLAETIKAMVESGFTDPEGYFLLAAFVAKHGVIELAMATLARSVHGGFCCPTPMREDPYFEPIRGLPAYAALLKRAEAVQAEAREAFARAGGLGVLGR